MRVCHVITGLSQGGAEQALFRLLTTEVRPGDVLVVSLTGKGVLQGPLQAMGFRVECLQLGSVWSSLIEFVRLVRLMKEWKPEVVQTWMYHADLFGGLAAVAAGVPVCWGIRSANLSPDLSKFTTICVARLCALLSSLIPTIAVSCSARAVEVHQRHGYRCKFVIVPNGLDSGRWHHDPASRVRMRTALGVNEGEFVFAHAARADKLKDHDTLARSFSYVASAQRNVSLILCGPGLTSGDPYFEKLPFTEHSRNRVRALGPQNNLPEIWNAADGFVLSSIGEGFPNVVVEAMASGLPCVVTDVGDSAEIVGQTGIVVAPSDPIALAGGMIKLCKLTAEERLQRGDQARQRIAHKFTLNRMAAGFRQVWSDVIIKGKY